MEVAPRARERAAGGGATRGGHTRRRGRAAAEAPIAGTERALEDPRRPGGEGPLDHDEIDDDLWPWRPPTPTLGPLGQLAAAVVLVFLLGVTVVGAMAVLSRVFR